MSMERVDVSQPLEGARYEKDGHVARITLDRPDRGNSFTPAMRPVFRSIWEDVREDPGVRCVILTAAGERHFCAGGDTGAGVMGAMTGDGPLTDEVFWSPKENRVWKPVIAAVNGDVIGAGFHFLNDCDVIVAADHARFYDFHVHLGIVGGIENVGLARRLPLGTALRMTLLGPHYKLTAERAYQLGLVDELVGSDELAATVDEMAARICEASPHAVSYSLQAVWNAQETGYSQALEHAWALVRAHWNHPDSVEGPRAFLEKRPPVWEDRPDWRQRAEEA